MSLTLGVSTPEHSRVVLHLLDISSNKNTSSSSSNEQSIRDEHHPFPTVQSNNHEDEREVDSDEGDLDQSHLVVQGPVHMNGTATQAINYINHRINPKEQEPRMYFRPLPAAPEQDTDDEENNNNNNRQGEAHSRGVSLVELVISTKYRDDVQVQVEDIHQMESFLEVIPHIHAQTFYLRVGPDGTCLPSAIAGSLDKVLSGHPTLKRLWLQATTTTSTDTEMDQDNKADGMHYSIAASILKHPKSCIQDIMVEGYGDTGILNNNNNAHGDSQHAGLVATGMDKNIESFLQALEENSSVSAISFIKTNNETLHYDKRRARIAAMILRLGQTLCVNRSIEKLYLGNLLEYLSYEEVESFAKSIRRMKWLKILDLRLVHRLVLPRPDLRFGHHNMQRIINISPRHQSSNYNDRRPPNAVNPSVRDNEGHNLSCCLLQPIVDALEENCSLIKIPGWKKYVGSTTYSEQQKEDMEALANALNYQLQLNRSRAKQFVHEPTLSIAAWPLVLEKCRGNPTAMYYCLRYKVASVCVRE